MIKAVLFDNDGVLINSELLVKKSQLEILQTMGANIDLNYMLTQTIGISVDDIIKTLYSNISEEELQQAIKNINNKFINSLDGLEAIDGVNELLSNFELPYAIGTSGCTDTTIKKLVKAELIDYFKLDNIITSDITAKPKPSPEVYLKAAKSIGFKAENCLVVDDSVSGVIAGVKSGAIAFGFIAGDHILDKNIQKNDLLNAGATLVFDDMADLPNLIKKFNQKKV